MTLGDGILWSTVLLLLAACGGSESSAPPMSDRERACFSDLNKMAMQHSSEERAQFDAALQEDDSDAMREFLESGLARSTAFDLHYCRERSKCFDGLSDEQRSDSVRRCTKTRLRENYPELF